MTQEDNNIRKLRLEKILEIVIENEMILIVIMKVLEMIKGKNYEITAKNILGHEIIGLAMKVIDASDKGRKGIEGIVVDETKKTLTVLGKHAGGNLKEQEEKKFVLPKEECVFEFDLNGEKSIVNGKNIMKRPEDRVKEWRN